MSKQIWQIVFLILILTVAATAQNKSKQTTEITGVYTDLSSEKCKTIESNANEAGSYRGLCAGAGGYKLELLEGDLRQSINIIAANKKKFELEFWSVVTGRFSSVGDKAEWRMQNVKGKPTPIALIVRLNAQDGDDAKKNVSYLVVSKITANAACVVDVIKPAKDANETARKSADSAAKKPCRAEALND